LNAVPFMLASIATLFGLLAPALDAQARLHQTRREQALLAAVARCALRWRQMAREPSAFAFGRLA
jgi:hypothetical protein